jgi:hypothetical protein
LRPQVGADTLADGMHRLPLRIATLALLAVSCSGTKQPSYAASAALLIAEMRSDFRACYNSALAATPDMTGCARLAVVVGADGRVQRVATTSRGLSESVVSCIRTRASRSVFDPPAGGRAVINFPVGLVPNGQPDSAKRDSLALCESQTPMPDTAADSVPRPIKRFAASAVTTRMGFFWDIKPNCLSFGIPVVRVVRAAQHGQVTIREDTGFSTYPQTNPHSHCNQTEVPGVSVWYASTSGYVGADSAVVEGLFPDGGHQLVEYLIAVK